MHMKMTKCRRQGHFRGTFIMAYKAILLCAFLFHCVNFTQSQGLVSDNCKKGFSDSDIMLEIPKMRSLGVLCSFSSTSICKNDYNS